MTNLAATIPASRLQGSDFHAINVAAIGHYLVATGSTATTVGLAALVVGGVDGYRLLGIIEATGGARTILEISTESVIAQPGAESSHEIIARPYTSADQRYFLDESLSVALATVLPYADDMSNSEAITAYLASTHQARLNIVEPTELIDPYCALVDMADVIGSFVLTTRVFVIVIVGRQGENAVITARFADDFDISHRAHASNNIPVVVHS